MSVFRGHEQSSGWARFLFPIDDCDIKQTFWGIYVDNTILPINKRNDLLNEWNEHSLCIFRNIAFERGVVLVMTSMTILLQFMDIKDSNLKQIGSHGGTRKARSRCTTKVILRNNSIDDTDKLTIANKPDPRRDQIRDHELIAGKLGSIVVLNINPSASETSDMLPTLDPFQAQYPGILLTSLAAGRYPDRTRVATARQEQIALVQMDTRAQTGSGKVPLRNGLRLAAHAVRARDGGDVQEAEVLSGPSVRARIRRRSVWAWTRGLWRARRARGRRVCRKAGGDEVTQGPAA